MRAVVVYESLFGNTHKIAAGIREQQPDGEVACVPVAAGTADLITQVDLLSVGGPTRMHAMSLGMTRKKGVEDERKKTPDAHVGPVFDGPGLRDWFHDLGKPADSAGFVCWHLAPQQVLPSRHGRAQFLLGAAAVGGGSSIVAKRAGLRVGTALARADRCLRRHRRLLPAGPTRPG
jgi:hypothetical protein